MKYTLFIFTLLLSLSLYAKNQQLLYDYRNGQHNKISAELQKQAAFNNKVHLYYLGQSYFYGYGRGRNIQQGITYSKKSAELGYLPAQIFIAKYNLLVLNEPQKAFYWFKKAAQQNDEQAQMFVAAAYLYGYGTTRKADAARKYYIGAAKNGNPIAQYYLAEHFLDSKSSKNHKLGVLWLKRATKQNNSKAIVALGKLHYQGKGVKKDKQNAYRLWTNEAEKGNTNAMINLGLYYQNLDKPDNKKAIYWYTQAAKKNNAASQYQLGMIDLHAKNSNGALSWLQLAAINNDAKAMQQLSVIYNKGEIVEKNEELSKKWQKRSQQIKNNYLLKSSPDQKKQKVIAWLLNDEPATTKFADYQLEGIVSDWKSKFAKQTNALNQGPRLIHIKSEEIFSYQFELADPKKIKISEIINVVFPAWYQSLKPGEPTLPSYQVPIVPSDEKLEKLNKLAFFGNPRALYQVGQLYANGVGVEKNMEKAYELFQQSAALNYMKAEYELAILYLAGNGVEKNYPKAIALLNKAAYKGNAYAQYALGMIFEYGMVDEATQQQIPKDATHARAMYNLAASSNIIKAKYRLANLHLSGQFEKKLNKQDHIEHHQEIAELYQTAINHGINDAKLPMAYYSLDTNDKKKQKWAFHVAKRAHNNGDKHGTFLLALMYDRGIGVSENQSRAIKLLQDSSENNPIAEFMLGSYYYTGQGVWQNKQKALALLEKAARSNLPFALYNLVVIMHNENPKSNFIPLLNRAVAQHYIKAKILFADYYLVHKRDKKNLKQAMAIYQELAVAGYDEVQLKMGYLYEHGTYLRKDFQIAKKWYLRSAQQGNKTAQYLLANMYQVGKLGQPDFTQAKYWYEKAAKQSFTPALVALGFIYETMKYDYKNAFKWYQKAAELENPTADYDLALMYEYGKGITTNYTKAYELYSLAKKNNYSPALYNLAIMHLHGIGIRKSPHIALKLFEQAAKLGNTNALYQMAIMYEQGIGYNKNIDKAFAYYKKAALAGNNLAIIAVKRIERDSTTSSCADLFNQQHKEGEHTPTKCPISGL